MGILKTECKTKEVLTYRPAWMIERWRERLVWDVKRMVKMWQDNYFPNTGEESGACSSYGQCQFHTLCTSLYPAGFIDVEYEVNRWDPIARERKTAVEA
jgi:hypothetical protein